MKAPSLVTSMQPPPSAARIAIGDSFYSVGSCFAERMTERLRRYLFAVVLNPYGIVYNPLSVSSLLERGEREPDLFLHDGLWRSLGHHSQLAGNSPEQSLQHLIHADRLKAKALESSRWLLLTLGTAQTFRLAGSRRVVANCHRLPQSLFERHRLEPDDCLKALRSPLHAWLEADPSRQAVLTVSPVRYLRDGLIANNRGKAALLLVCETLERGHPRINYFPAYEIVIDELRSYRYFERDMVHPNALAADIVWQRFVETYFDQAAVPALREMDKLLAALEHRSSPLTDFKALASKSIERLRSLQQRHPQLQLHQWKERFESMQVLNLVAPSRDR